MGRGHELRLSLPWRSSGGTPALVLRSTIEFWPRRSGFGRSARSARYGARHDHGRRVRSHAPQRPTCDCRSRDDAVGGRRVLRTGHRVSRAAVGGTADCCLGLANATEPDFARGGTIREGWSCPSGRRLANCLNAPTSGDAAREALGWVCILILATVITFVFGQIDEKRRRDRLRDELKTLDSFRGRARVAYGGAVTGNPES